MQAASPGWTPCSASPEAFIIRRSGRVECVVLDIEGTTGSLEHVQHVLFPYARKHLRPWLGSRWASPAGRQILGLVRAEMHTDDVDEEEALDLLERWAQTDAKAAALKIAQGLIWAEGYAQGSLRGHVYSDVPAALNRWQSLGIACCIYSSGSERAQRDWFAYSNHGDLSELIDGYFDLSTAGPKRDSDSYRRIAASLEVQSERILFASDVGDELDAARAAGWQTIGVRRPGDPRGRDVSGHRVIETFDAIELANQT